jgi:flagellar P-ring protein precursor FlgI
MSASPMHFRAGKPWSPKKTNIQIRNEPGGLIQIPAAAQLQDVVRALNALGATPQDMLAILQAIKAAGALNAELEVI